MRPPAGAAPPIFLCAAHRADGDAPIAVPFLVRRVSVVSDAWFCGTSPAAGLAQREAVARLEAAVQAAGGLLNLHTVTSCIGRYDAPAPAGRAEGAGGDAEVRGVRH